MYIINLESQEPVALLGDAIKMRFVHIILGFTLLLGMVFEMIPNGLPLVQPFLLVNDEQYLRFHWYLIFEHLIKVVLSIVIMIAPLLTIPIKVFFVLQCCDVVEYMLTNSNVWYKIGWIPISFNTLQIFVYCGAVIWYELEQDD